MSSLFGDNDLADASDLEGLAGAPFTDTEADAAVAAVRMAAGWHIAPVRSDTAVVLSIDYPRTLLRLPTRRLISVEEVRDVWGAAGSGDDGAVIDDTTYRVVITRNVLLKTSGYWPVGLDGVEVDFTHGYSECPSDLLPVIAEAAVNCRRDQTIRTQSAGVFAVTYDDGSVQTGYPLSSQAALDRYLLLDRPGVA